MNHYPNCRALTSGHCDCDEGAIPGKVAHHPDDAESSTCIWPLEYAKDSAPIPPPHGDPFLSPWQTNPTAGTPEDAADQLDMARDMDLGTPYTPPDGAFTDPDVHDPRDLDRALKALENEGEG